MGWVSGRQRDGRCGESNCAQMPIRKSPVAKPPQRAGAGRERDHHFPVAKFPASSV